MISVVTSARTVRGRLPGREPQLQRPRIGSCLGMFEEQEQKERCRYSTLSKEVETGRDSVFKAMGAPVRSLEFILSGLGVPGRS